MKKSTPGCPSHHVHAAAQRTRARVLICVASLVIGLHGRSLAAAVLDESFGDVPLASVSLQQGAPQLFALAVQADGKVIIGGAFDQVAGQPRMEIARLEADGTLDPSFTSPFEMTSVGATIHTLGLDGSGGIFVGGAFVVGGALETLVKLKADGSVDGAFVEEPALRLSQIAKILVSGDKLYVATVGAGGLDRLEANGRFDPTFTHFSDASSQNLDFALQSSGSLVLGLDEAVVQIGGDGKLAGAFTAVPAAYPMLGSAKGGDVLFFANFAEINATAPDKRIARLGANGGVASSFAVDPLVRSFVGVLSDDTLLIEQQLPSGESLVRLAPNGAPDGFVVPIDDVVRTIAAYPDNRLMIAGMFGQVDHKPRTRIARIFESSLRASGAGGSGGSVSTGGDSGARGSGTDSGDAGDSGAASSPQGGASGNGALSAGAGSNASNGGVPASRDTPQKGPIGGCAFTRPVGWSSALAAWLTLGALALLCVRQKRGGTQANGERLSARR